MKHLKRKGWSIVLRNKETGDIFGYSYVLRNFSNKQLTVVRDHPDSKYRDRYPHPTESLAQKISELNEKVQWLSDEKYELFITRTGSKNCPISINWMQHINKYKRRPSEQYESNLEMLFKVKREKRVD